MTKIVNCKNCQKGVKLGEKEVYYLIRDNFKKYGYDCWCSNCLKAVQKICEEKWGVNKDCLFGEHDGEVLKYDPKSEMDFCCQWSICPWCEVKVPYNMADERHLDHFYHFHGKDKGKCNKEAHKTEEEMKSLENSGLPECKDVRKLYYVKGSPDVNDNNDNGRERERERAQNWGTEKTNWGLRGYCRSHSSTGTRITG